MTELLAAGITTVVVTLGVDSTMKTLPGRARRRRVRADAGSIHMLNSCVLSNPGSAEPYRLPGTWSAQPAVLEVVEWCEPFPRDLVLCDGDGVGLAEVGLDVRQRGLSLTAYLDWSGFDRTRADGIAGTHRAAVESAVDQVHAYLQARAGERFREAAGHHPPRRPTSIPF